MDSTIILITGASGHIGKRAAELLAQQNVKMRLMTRSPEKAPNLPGSLVVPGDFQDKPSLARAFAGITAALVISGKAQPGERARLHNNAFHAAATAGVKHLVYLSLKGTSPESVYPYCRDHYESEQFLAASGVPFTALRGAFYMDMLFSKYDEDSVIRGPAGDGRAAFIAREDTARAAAAAILGSPRGILEVTGRQMMSLDEASCRLSEIMDREYRYERETPEQTRRRLSATDMPEWAKEAEVNWFEAIAKGEQAPPTHGYQRLTAMEPLNLEQYCSTHPDVLDELNHQSARAPVPSTQSSVLNMRTFGAK
jgi:uncharacterized protein YbjT (DUF2867 family)